MTHFLAVLGTIIGAFAILAGLDDSAPAGLAPAGLILIVGMLGYLGLDSLR